MTNRKKICTTVVIELISLLVTFAIFFCTEWGEYATAIDLTSLLFVVLSELACFTCVILLSLDDCKFATVFGWSGFTSTSVLYFAFSLTMVLIRNNYLYDTQKFVLHQVIGLAVFVVVMLLVYLAASKVIESDNIMSAKFAAMQKIEDRIMELCSDSRYIQYKPELEELHEMVLYADKSVSGEIDADIEKSLSELEQTLVGTDDSKADAVRALLQKIKDLFVQRRRGYSRNNRGGF